MGKLKSARKLTLRDFHDQINHGSSLSEVEVVSIDEEAVSIDEEDGDSVVVTEVEDDTPLITTVAWPKLGKMDSNLCLNSSAKGKIPVAPVGRTPREDAKSPIVQGNTSGSKSSVWENPLTLPRNEVKKEKLRKHLKKFSVEYVNNQVMIPPEITKIGALKWKFAIVGCFVDKSLSYYQVRSWAQEKWNIDADDVVSLDNGFIVFNLKDEGSQDSILENGPYFCGGKHFVIKKWHPGMQLTKSVFTSVPVWVKLYNVPLESWTEDGLSYIASWIGNPLYMDDFTQEHSRLTFARVCVEVDATKEIPSSFVVNLGYGEPYEVRVEVPWKPQVCKICNIFGHATNACPKPRVMASQAWKAIEKVGQEVSVQQERLVRGKAKEDTKWIEVKKKNGQGTPRASTSKVGALDSKVVQKIDDKEMPSPIVVSSSCFEVLANENSSEVEQIPPSNPLSTPFSAPTSKVLDSIIVQKKDDVELVPSPVVVSPSYVEVLKSRDMNEHSNVVEQVSSTSPSELIHNPVCKMQPENDTVAPRRSTRFREPPRIPLEGDFIGPNAPIPKVSDPSPPRGDNKKKLKEKIKMLKASRDKMM